MKITVSFKDPQALEEIEPEVRDKLKKWIKWGEYVTIEFDVSENTATVVEQNSP